MDNNRKKGKKGILISIAAIIILLLIFIFTFFSKSGIADFFNIFKKEDAIESDEVIEYLTQQTYVNKENRNVQWYCTKDMMSDTYETYMTLYDENDFVKVFPIVGVWTSGTKVIQPTARIYYVTEKDEDGNIVGQFVPEVDNLKYSEDQIEYHRIVFNEDLSILVGLLKSNNGVVYQKIVVREPEDKKVIEVPVIIVPEPPTVPDEVIAEIQSIPPYTGYRPEPTESEEIEEKDDDDHDPDPVPVPEIIPDPIPVPVPETPEPDPDDPHHHRKNADYKVEHIRQALDGSYGNNNSLTTTETGRGRIGSVIKTDKKNYTGFTALSYEDVKIKKDNSSVLQIKYQRNKYRITFNENNGKEVYSKDFLYEASVSDSTPVREGYEFGGWAYKNSSGTVISKPNSMPAENLTAEAKWNRNAAKYTVKHIRQNLDGNYNTLVETDEMTGDIGQNTEAAIKTYKGFTALDFTNVPIKDDGSTEVVIKYQRNKYKITYDGSTDKEFLYEENVVELPAPIKTNYEFQQWNYKNSSNEDITKPTKMPAENLTATSSWLGEVVNYQVRHIRQSLDGTYGNNATLIETVPGTSRFGVTVIPNTKSYVGFTVITPSETVLGVNTVIDVHYKRNSHKVTFYDGNGNKYEEKDVLYGDVITEPTTNPEREGHDFDGWAYIGEPGETKPSEMPDHAIVVQPKWKIKQYTIKYYSDSIGGTLHDTKTLDYNSTVITPAVNPIKFGHTFSFWKYYKESDSSEVATPTKVPAYNLVAVANYDADPVNYTIKHIRQNLDGTYSTLVENEPKTGHYGETVTIIPKTYVGFTAAGTNPTSVDLGIDTEVELYYVRNTYKVHYTDALNSYDKYVELKFEAPVSVLGTLFPDAPSKTGYSNSIDYYVNSLNQNVGTPANMPAYDIFYIPNWVANTFTVTYHSNGGVGADVNQVFTYDEAQNLKGIKNILGVNSGYSRAGYYVNTTSTWNTAADGSGTPYANEATNIKNLTVVNNDVIHLYADWEQKTINLSYDGNGANETAAAAGMTSHSYSYEGTGNIRSNNYTKTGYTYTGYYNTAADGSGTSIADGAAYTVINNYIANDITKAIKLNDVYEASIDVPLYTQWRKNNYTIEFNLNGGSGTMDSINAEYDTDYTLDSSAISRTGYTFKEWNTLSTGSGTSYTGDATISNLTSTDGDIVTLYAIWEPIHYTIHFVIEPYGEVSGSIDDITAEYGVNYTFPATAISRTGYKFDKWTQYSDGSGNSYNSTSEYNNLTSVDGAYIVLYSQWTPISYTVKFNVNGGSGSIADKVVNYDSVFSADCSSVTKTGYVLDHWNTASDDSGTNLAMINNDVYGSNLTTTDGGEVTIYAQWTPITYTLHLDLNGGNSTMYISDVTCTYDVNYTLMSEATLGLNRDGYGFTGWNTAADGSGTGYSDEATVKNLTTTQGSTVTLYAQWVQGYTIHYQCSNYGYSGTMSDSFFPYGGTGNITENAFTLEGYHFDHWEDGNGNSYTDKAAFSDLNFGTEHEITLTTNLEENSYTVVYKLNGATGTEESRTYTYSETFYLPDIEYDLGYTYPGYYITDSNYPFNTKADGSGTSYNKWDEISGLSAENGASIDLYVQWSPKTVNVYYYNPEDYGQSMSPTAFTVGVGGNLANSTFTKSGAYEFECWNTEYNYYGNDIDDGASFSYVVTAFDLENNSDYTDTSLESIDLYIYAKFKGVIKLYANYPSGYSGSATISSTTSMIVTDSLITMYVGYNDSPETPDTPFECEGWTFKGWNTKADGTGTSFNNKVTTSYSGGIIKNYNGTLYAKWQQPTTFITCSAYPGNNTVKTALGVNTQEVVKHIVIHKDTAVPDGVTKYDCTDTGTYDGIKADEKIYMVYESGTNTLHYYTKAKKIYFGSDNNIAYYNNGYFSNLTALQDITGLGDIDLKYRKTMKGMFYCCTSLTSTQAIAILNQIDTSIVTNMQYMFRGCTGLGDVTMVDLDYKNCTSMEGMFYDAGIGDFKISGGDYSKVTSMKDMFSHCSVKTISISGVNFAELTTMKTMCAWAGSLEECSITDVDTPKLKEMNLMFCGIETNNLTAARNMETCDLSGIDTNNVTDMNSIFGCCEKLKDLNISTWNTSSLKYLQYAFSWCGSLETLDLSSFKTSSLTNVQDMFTSCGSLKTIYVGDNWNINSFSSTAIFSGCNSLTGGYGFKYSTNGASDKNNAKYAVANTSTTNGYMTGKSSAIIYGP